MILCGTDLSVASEPAMRAAAALARKLRKELLLVAVLERSDASRQVDADVRLQQDAGELRRTFDIPVETLVDHGAPEERILDLAAKRQASLIVVGAGGSAKRARGLGSVAESLCQKAEVPVFIARNADDLLPWSQHSRPLRVLLGSGMGDASRSALEYITAWSDLALTVAHVAWPFGEHYRLGIAGAMLLDHLRPELHRQLLSDLGRWAAETPGHGGALSVTPGYGRIDCHLAQLAQEHQADVLVVGTHRRNLASRIWHGSVSRNSIHEAECNVLCVPQRRSAADLGPSPRTVVVPTDFTSLADRAVRYAYSLLEQGGTVHLVHVASNLEDLDQVALRAQLAARIPPGTESRGIKTELQLLEGSEAWLAVWQYAGRASADLICMATHSRDAARSLVLGSQAQAVLQHSRIPVLLVPPDREA